MLPTLTDRQKAIYDFLLKSIREQGFAPSIHEIGRQFKIASTNGVSDHLKALEKKGYIRRVGKRAIEVVNALVLALDVSPEDWLEAVTAKQRRLGGFSAGVVLVDNGLPDPGLDSR